MMNKIDFIRSEFPRLLETLAPEEKGKWGVMNSQQMVEHMTESVSQATGANNQQLHTPADHLPKFREFMLSEKEFRPNTKNALLEESPAPVKLSSMEEAIGAYRREVARFEEYFAKHPEATITNPVFGDLNFGEWIHLLHKHALHHAKQFGLVSDTPQQ